MYARTPKSGLIGGLYENASGIFIFYACITRGIIHFFYFTSPVLKNRESYGDLPERDSYAVSH